MSPADEAFGPPHTGHQDVVPPDLHPHAPLPPPIPVVPDIPMAGGVPEPAETGCPRHLGGFTLLSPSWQDFIHANPLPAQQTATVVWAKGDVSPEQRRRIEKSIRSYQARITEHEAKREHYRANPDAFDNQERLKKASSDEERQRIIAGRIRKLEKEIAKFRREIAKLHKQLE